MPQKEMSTDLKAIGTLNGEAIVDLEKAASAEGATVAEWEALTAKENETYEAQNKQLVDAAKAIADNTAAKEAAIERKKKADARAAELRELIAKKKEANGPTSGDPVVDYANFIKERGNRHHEVLQRLAVWTKAASYSSQEIRNAPLHEAFAFLDSWPSFQEETTAAIATLSKQAEDYKAKGADVADAAALSASFDELKALYDKSGALLLREQARRSAYEQDVIKVLESQNSLLHWCRQQRAALDGLKEADHIQEFCASLQNNIGRMETNFLVIMEMAEQLVPNPKVEKALIEVAEVWMALEVFAYEKLRTTLVDLHHKSGLEGECKLWAEFSVRFKKFLQDADRLLEMPTDEDSKALTRPTLETCKGLLSDHDLHLIITEHLSDFSLREECVKDHYAAIRRTIFSKLTLLTQSFVGHQSYARKQEYTDRLAELSDWIDCKSQNNAWKDLLQRVEKMRLLVEANEVTSTSDTVPATA